MLKNNKSVGDIFSMFIKRNVTAENNVISMDIFQNNSDCCVILHYFKCFLEKKYKRKYTIDAYIKDVKQYIDWYFSNNADKHFILDEKNLLKYERFLRSIKKYKESTITYKKVALRKVNKFLIEFNRKNGNEEFFSNSKSNRNHYNYLTKSYIKL